MPKSGLTTASLIFQTRRFIRHPRSPINFSQPCQVVSKSRSMKTMSNLCLNHLSQKIRLSQQISSPLPVPRVRRCQGSSTRDYDGDDADCDSYHHRSGSKTFTSTGSIGKSKSLAVVIRGHELGLPITLDANFLNIPDVSAGGYERSRQPVRESIGKNSFRPFQRCSGRWQARLSRRETVHSIHGLRCGSLESRNHRLNRRWQTRLVHGRRNRRE